MSPSNSSYLPAPPPGYLLAVDCPADPAGIVDHYAAVPVSTQPLTDFMRRVSINYLFAILLHYSGGRHLPCTLDNVLALGKLASLPAMLSELATDPRCTRYIEHLRLAQLAGAQQLLDRVAAHLAADLASVEPTDLARQQTAPVLRAISWPA